MIKLFKTEVFSKEIWETAKKSGAVGLEMDCPTVITKSSDGTKYHAIFSTASKDRHGEIVYQNFDLKSFKKNPVYLDSHNYGSIEHILGKIVGIKSGDVLEGDIEFAMDNPKGVLASRLAEKGFLNTSSIGFIPKEFDETGNITKSELLEISAVSVPANAEALFERKENGETTDGDDIVGDEDNGEDKEDNKEGGDDDGKEGGEEIIADEKIEEEKEEKIKANEPIVEDKKKAKAEGDECKLDDGSVGIIARDDEGNFVCYPKSKKDDKEKIVNAVREALLKEKEVRIEAVNQIAKYVQKLKDDSEIKRNIFKGLRDLLSKDIAL